MKCCLIGNLLNKLLSHQRLSIADSDDLASRDPLDLRCMRICDFAASYDGDFKHALFSFRQLSKKRLNPSSVGIFGFQPTRVLSFSLL